MIAVNDSFLLAPWADVLYGCDETWWQSRGASIRKIWHGGEGHIACRFGTKVTLENKIEGVLRLRNTGEEGLETDPTGLRTGKNSGYQAINLAYHFGAKRIVLLGFDMRLGPSGEMHWNARPERQTPAGFAQTLSLMLPKFDTLKEPLKRAGVEVLNATPNSALKTWPYVPLEDILAQSRRNKADQPDCQTHSQVPVE